LKAKKSSSNIPSGPHN